MSQEITTHQTWLAILKRMLQWERLADDSRLEPGKDMDFRKTQNTV